MAPETFRLLEPLSIEDEQRLKQLRERILNFKRVFVAYSGGVDSTRP